jgi:hypothetical protein
VSPRPEFSLPSWVVQGPVCPGSDPADHVSKHVGTLNHHPTTQLNNISCGLILDFPSRSQQGWRTLAMQQFPVSTLGCSGVKQISQLGYWREKSESCCWQAADSSCTRQGHNSQQSVLCLDCWDVWVTTVSSEYSSVMMPTLALKSLRQKCTGYLKWNYMSSGDRVIRNVRPIDSNLGSKTPHYGISVHQEWYTLSCFPDERELKLSQNTTSPGLWDSETWQEVTQEGADVFV